MKNVLSATMIMLTFFSSNIIAQRIVNCPQSSQILVSTNSRGQQCWSFNANNPDGDNGQFFLSCVDNKPLPTGGSAILSKIDDSIFTRGSTYIFCYYNTSPQSSTIDQSELWVRLQGIFRQVGPTQFEEVSPDTPASPMSERTITSQEPSSSDGQNGDDCD